MRVLIEIFILLLLRNRESSVGLKRWLTQCKIICCSAKIGRAGKRNVFVDGHKHRRNNVI